MILRTLETLSSMDLSHGSVNGLWFPFCGWRSVSRYSRVRELRIELHELLVSGMLTIFGTLEGINLAVLLADSPLNYTRTNQTWSPMVVVSYSMLRDNGADDADACSAREARSCTPTISHNALIAML